MSEFGVFNISSAKMREELFTAVYGMVSVLRKNKTAEKFSDEQVKDMCHKYAEQYTDQMIKKSRENKTHLQ